MPYPAKSLGIKIPPFRVGDKVDFSFNFKKYKDLSGNATDAHILIDVAKSLLQDFRIRRITPPYTVIETKLDGWDRWIIYIQGAGYYSTIYFDKIARTPLTAAKLPV